MGFVILKNPNPITVFENHPKSYIQHFELTNSLKMAKMVTFGAAGFWKPEASGQKVLPDILVIIRQKLVENAKIEKKLKCDILCDFQTLCPCGIFF